MTDEKKYREWWVNLHATYEKGFYEENPGNWLPSYEGQVVHVVEYSALEAAQARIKGLEKEVSSFTSGAGAGDDRDSWAARAWEYLGDIVALKEKNAELIKSVAKAEYLYRKQRELQRMQRKAKRQFRAAYARELAKNAGFVEALNILACWGEGDKVTSSFDHPTSATLAREALKEYGLSDD